MNSVQSGEHAQVPLAAILRTGDLTARMRRPANFEAENHALAALAKTLASAPLTIFQRLVETAMSLCDADSAGLSVEGSERDQDVFRWHTVAGQFAPHVQNVTPRRFSTCGTAVDLDTAQLMVRPGRHFTYLEDLNPPIEEALLVPFHVDGKAVGTVWVIAHGAMRKFDQEDARILASIADFAGMAYQVVTSRSALQAEIRERTQAQLLLRNADRTKDEFLAMLAHELRNPLAPIRNALLLLRRSKRDEVSSARARDVLDRQVANMVRLIDDLLDVSRIRLGKFALVSEPLELSEVLASALESSRPALDARMQRVAIRQPAEVVPINGDGVRLSQLLLNLLNNAAKYTPRGGTIAVTVEADDDWATIAIKDSGVGIAPHRIGQIFELFAQAGQSQETSDGGLGVGLHLVKTIAELHGGTVSASSGGLGQGSEFIVRLPTTRERVGSTTMFAAQPEPVCPDRLRIVVADDNVDATMTLALLLRSCGHNVEMAFDGEEAVSLAASFKPDVLLLDVGMPKMSGDAAARAIRATGLPAALISLTGWSPLDLERRDQASVFDGHLTKPVEFEDVERLLKDFSASLPGRVARRATSPRLPQASTRTPETGG